MIKAIAKLVLALNSNVKKTQIAAGISWGLLLGLLPAGNAFWILIFILSLFLKHNQGGKLFLMAIMKVLAPITASAIDGIGWSVLHIASLQSLFTTMYNMPFVPFTNFNNTLVAGGLAAGIVLWIPVFVIITLLIPFYRNTLLPKILNNKILTAVQNSPLIVKIRDAMNVITDIKNLNL